LLELKRATTPLRLRHLRYLFALEQLAKGYVLRGQGHWARGFAGHGSRLSVSGVERLTEVVPIPWGVALD
jgi:hypothetical protein